MRKFLKGVKNSFVVNWGKETLGKKILIIILMSAAFTLLLSLKFPILFYSSLYVIDVCLLFFIGKFLFNIRDKLTLEKMKVALQAVKESAKKAVKAYFCFFIEEGSTVFWNVALFVVLILVTIIIDNYFSTEWWSTEWWTMVQVSFWFSFAHFVVSSIIFSIFIEVPGNYLGKKLWCEVLLVEEKPIKLDKPIWANGEWFGIEKINYSNSGKETEVCFFITSYYKNLEFKIPVSVKLYLKEKFDWLELFNVLRENQPQQSTLKLNKYIKDLLVVGDNFDNDIGCYAANIFSAQIFLDEAIKHLSLPENIFSNVSKTKISLRKPTFSANKTS